MPNKYENGTDVKAARTTQFSTFLGYIQAQKKMTEAEMGKKMGISQAQFHMLKVGQRAPKTGDIDRLKDWAKALKLVGDEAKRFVEHGTAASLPEEVATELEALRAEVDRLKAENAKLRSK